MRNRARHWAFLLAVVLMSGSIAQVFAAELRAKAAEMRAEEDEQLRELLTYSGPDVSRQTESLVKLTEILGYTAYPAHQQILEHQNITQFGDREQDLILAFRGLGKSSTGTVVRAIAYALRDPDIRILIASHTAGAAEELHQEIHSHLSENLTLVRLFGDFYSEGRKGKVGRYSDKKSTILQRQQRTLKEGTFNTLGVGKQGASRHYDVVFADDLVTLESSRTKTQRKNLVAWYGSTLVGTWLPHTKVHHIGTRYYPHDLWEDFTDGRQDEAEGVLAHATLKIPAILNMHAPEDEWIASHPERYPISACLRRLRIAGRYHFMAQYQQDTKSGEGIIVNYSDLRWYGNGEAMPPAAADMQIFQYSDLAAKKTDTGDFFVNMTVGVGEGPDGPRVWFLDIVRERCGIRKQRETILSQAAKWRPYRAGVEAVAFQAGFAEEIQDMTMLPVDPIPVNKDKVFNLQKVAHLVEGHKVYLPLPATPLGKLFAPLVDELSTFPEGDNDDCVDGFSGVLDLAIFGGPKAAAPVPEDEYNEDTGLLAEY